MEYVIEMLNITKQFPGIKANDDISIQLKKGEIHALLGENGAGKSTLMSILFGLYQPDSGIIKINGEQVNISNPNIANKLGIGMVHQHFKLVDNFTVVENIILGMEPKKSFGRIDLKKAKEVVKNLSEQYGLNVDLDAKISDITVGMQQRVEILKTLYRNANILIFDEPTAVLTPQEIQELISIMRRLIDEGKSIILITHKLKEIKQVADRCTVLRKGKYIGTINVAETTENEMAKMMVGRDVSFNVEKAEYHPSDVVLKVDNITVKNARNIEAVKNVSFEVKKGQIFCICGIDGNGQSEIIEAITGLTKVESGKIFLDGKDITDKSIRQKTLSGIGHIPEDRHKYGLVLDFNLEENIALQTYYTDELSQKGRIKFKERTMLSDRLIEEFDIRSSLGSKTVTRQMSGGNQQKAIIAREINRKPELLIAAQPTRGLDIGAIEYIHKRLVERRDNNDAVLLMSLELDEVIDLSDVIAVIHDGKITGIVESKEVNENLLGLMMAGLSKEEAMKQLQENKTEAK
jgi:ribose ABC superfamily ATP binding cassette transporter, ABC protein